MDEWFLYPPTDEQHVRAWLRAHRDDFRNPLTGRRMKGTLADAAATAWGITERSPLWRELVQWVMEECA